MEKAQETQKRWYDLNARDRTFEVGEKILVLLPTSTNKLSTGPVAETLRGSEEGQQGDLPGGDAEQAEKTPKLPHQ